MSDLIWLQPGMNLGKKTRKNYARSESFIHSASISFPNIGNSLESVLKNNKVNQSLLDIKMVHEACLCAPIGWKRCCLKAECIYKTSVQFKEITNKSISPGKEN